MSAVLTAWATCSILRPPPPHPRACIRTEASSTATPTVATARERRRWRGRWARCSAPGHFFLGTHGAMTRRRRAEYKVMVVRTRARAMLVAVIQLPRLGPQHGMVRGAGSWTPPTQLTGWPWVMLEGRRHAKVSERPGLHRPQAGAVASMSAVVHCGGGGTHGSHTCVGARRGWMRGQSRRLVTVRSGCHRKCSAAGGAGGSARHARLCCCAATRMRPVGATVRPRHCRPTPRACSCWRRVEARVS